MKTRSFTFISLLLLRKRFCKGFTLIELLVVIGVLALLGVIFSDTLIQTLRGGNKVRILNQVKQNGQVVLEKLTGEIRQAEKIICVGDNRADHTDTIVFFKQGIYTRFRFYPPKPSDNPSSNGYIAWDNPEEEDNLCMTAQIFPFIPTPTAPMGGGHVGLEVESVPTPTPLLPFSFTQYLTNIDPVSGISLDYAGEDDFTDKIFKQDSKAGFADMVTIKFKVTAGVGAGQAYETTVKEGGVLFNTTVSVRGGK